MKGSLAQRVGYRMVRTNELACPNCVYCDIEIVRTKPVIKRKRYCTKYKCCVARDCVCNELLKVRSGTETCA